MVVITGIILKGRCIVILESLQRHALEQLHVKHIGIKKTKLLGCKLIHCIGYELGSQKPHKNCSTCLDFQQMQPKEKIIQHKFPAKPWKVIGTAMYNLHNRYYLYIVDYYSKFPVIKKKNRGPIRR